MCWLEALEHALLYHFMPLTKAVITPCAFSIEALNRILHRDAVTLVPGLLSLFVHHEWQQIMSKPQDLGVLCHNCLLCAQRLEPLDMFQRYVDTR